MANSSNRSSSIQLVELVVIAFVMFAVFAFVIAIGMLILRFTLFSLETIPDDMKWVATISVMSLSAFLVGVMLILGKNKL